MSVGRKAPMTAMKKEPDVEYWMVIHSVHTSDESLVALTVSLKVAKMAELMAESLDISMAAMMERSTVVMLVTRRAAE